MQSSRLLQNVLHLCKSVRLMLAMFKISPRFGYVSSLCLNCFSPLLSIFAETHKYCFRDPIIVSTSASSIAFTSQILLGSSNAHHTRMCMHVAWLCLRKHLSGLGWRQKADGVLTYSLPEAGLRCCSASYNGTAMRIQSTSLVICQLDGVSYTPSVWICHLMREIWSTAWSVILGSCDALAPLSIFCRKVLVR